MNWISIFGNVQHLFFIFHFIYEIFLIIITDCVTTMKGVLRLVEFLSYTNVDVLRSSWINRSREHWLWLVRYSQKKELIINFFVFYCSGKPSILLITLEPLVQFKWGFQQMYLSKWALQSNWKLKMSQVWVQTDISRSHHIV